MTATATDTSYTMRVAQENRSWDTVEMLAAGEVVNVLHVNHYDGRVTWCSNWSQIHDLIAAGVCRTVSLGPGTYGHTDVYFS